MTSKALASLINMLGDGTINGRPQKRSLKRSLSGKAPEDIVKAKGVTQISDTGELASIIDSILTADPDSVARFKGGETKLMGFFVGQVMKATKGQGNPKMINQLLREKLEASSRS